MAPRRIGSTWRPRSEARTSSGSTRLLHTMMDSATVSMTTMAVAADNPPTKASSVSQARLLAAGNASTKPSPSAPGPKVSSPAMAMGTTKRLMATR